MKKIIHFCFILLSFNGFAQAYELDTNFGVNGFARLTNKTGIRDYTYFAGKYYLLLSSSTSDSTSNLIVVNPDGTIYNTLTIDYYMLFTTVGGSLYAYGGNDSHQDIKITKFSADGNIDNGFGLNGTKTIDFGFNEEHAIGICAATDGSLLCAASRRNTNQTSIAEITFKLNPATGELITDYDPNVFKVKGVTSPYTNNYYYSKMAMLAYQSNFLLIRCHAGQMVTQLIDSNGDNVNTYGTNGIRNFTLTWPITAEIKKVAIAGDLLYNQHSYYTGVCGGSKSLAIADLNTGSILFNAHSQLGDDHFYSTFSIDSDKVYSGNVSDITCEVSTNQFKIRRQLLDGSMDNTFHQSGNFSYQYTGIGNVTYERNETQMVLKNDDGSLTVAGYAKVIDQFSPTFPFEAIYWTGLVMSRLVESDEPLATHDYNLNEMTLAPNPFEEKITLISITSINHIDLYDLTGRKLTSPKFKMVGSDTDIDLSFISDSGTYLLKIHDGEKTITRKIIKK